MNSRSLLYKLSRKILYVFLPAVKFNSLLFGLLRAIQTIYYTAIFLKKHNDTRRFQEIIGNTQGLLPFSFRLAGAKAFARLWNRMIHFDYENTARLSDFGEIDKLHGLMNRGAGLLVVTYHYGPQAYTYLLHKHGISPNLLIGITNLDDLRKADLLRRPDKEFLAAYPKLHLHNSEERAFLKSVLNKEAGLIMMDYQSDTTSVTTSLFGTPYPIGTFPFKIAQKYNVPIAIVWFNQLKSRKGFKLNVCPLNSSEMEQNIHKYSSILENITREEPGLWATGFECLHIRKTT